ncbi:MAG: YueI family protein [Lactobacillus sp.]
MTEDLNTRLQQEAEGITPQTKPDERRRYLGSLRERVFVRLTNQECHVLACQRAFLKHIRDYRPYTVLINANMPQTSFIDDVIASCADQKVNFTYVSDETAKKEPDATGLLVVASQAINRPRIEILQVYAPEIPQEKLPAPKKKGWFARLFKRGR